MLKKLKEMLFGKPVEVTSVVEVAPVEAVTASPVVETQVTDAVTVAPKKARKTRAKKTTKKVK